jgi:hypothetical protein
MAMIDALPLKDNATAIKTLDTIEKALRGQVAGLGGAHSASDRQSGCTVLCRSMWVICSTVLLCGKDV